MVWTDNKVLVTLYVPLIEKKYEVFLPIGRKIGEILFLLSKSIGDISDGVYNLRGDERLYNRITGQEYKLNEVIKDTNVRNGTQLIFI